MTTEQGGSLRCRCSAYRPRPDKPVDLQSAGCDSGRLPCPRHHRIDDPHRRSDRPDRATVLNPYRGRAVRATYDHGLSLFGHRSSLHPDTRHRNRARRSVDRDRPRRERRARPPRPAYRDAGLMKPPSAIWWPPTCVLSSTRCPRLATSSIAATPDMDVCHSGGGRLGSLFF